MTKSYLFASTLLIGLYLLTGCENTDNSKAIAGKEEKATAAELPDYFNLRPNLEKEYSY